MFFIREWKLKRLINSEIHRYLKCNEIVKSNFILPCEICKHLIYREDAIKGPSEVRPSFPSGEHIHKMYYCPKCAAARKVKK